MKRRGFVISVSGKGGVGKTLLSVLLLRTYLDETDKTILMVDGDPATNLPEALGVEVKGTVADIAAKLKDDIQMGRISYDASKRDMLEGWIYEILVENPRFDLIAMGRGEGEGCYCSVNYMLTLILTNLIQNYDVTIMDMEAGLEHISRRVDSDVDVMFVITDRSRMGFKTVSRIKEVAEEVHVEVKRMVLIGNLFDEKDEYILREYANSIGLEYGGYIPYDENVSLYNMKGISILRLPDDSPSLLAVKSIAKKLSIL
ncbi:MAG: AAA family ATPase [Nitrososphaerota archaeon]|nr:AAA family ATPase [Candidatus Bathyarchaeota archaeon]MCX8162703.1 AAA family ATPase [Candidatus Bathyarchaeota archaeon]MDW8061719.1 AAA family ATPase [Nitrososphaerota archaeon]